MPQLIKVLSAPQDIASPQAEGRVGSIPASGSDERLKPLWTPSDKWLPPDPEPVLATDMGTHYIAYWNGEEWCDCYSDDVIDCHITHWTWLPDFPEE